MSRRSDLPDLPDVPPGTLAIGWATVELDRAARELSGLLAVGAAFADGPPSVTLGAWTRVGFLRMPTGSRLWIAILEASTEGRLAATLARAGEGWAVRWEASAGSAAASPAGKARRSAPRPGPFGPERLLLDEPLARPLRLLVTTATIGA